MFYKKKLGIILLSLVVLFMSACSTPAKYDYSAFEQSRPKSILVLPPINNTVDMSATYALYSQVTYPLAESGYYVFPVALVDETFKQNGVTVPSEIQAIPYNRLRHIFGADAALYISIDEYGAKYHIFSSDIMVSVRAKLIDLRNGKQIWSSNASASNQGNSAGSGNLLVTLLTAAVMQIANSVDDKSYTIAGITSNRLLFAGDLSPMNYNQNKLLYGARSPLYMKDFTGSN